MKKILPVLIAVIGLVGGVVAGTVLKPAAAETTEGPMAEGHSDDHSEKQASDHSDGHGEESDKSDEYIYVGMEKPFFAPIVTGNNSGALVRIDIHLEIPGSLEEAARRHEPKLRDAFLKAVLNFSEDGGFGRVHSGEGFEALRDDFLVNARKVLGPKVKNVLIGEILTRES